MIAVTGVTGALGGRVAARLAAAGGVPLRLVVRDAGRAPDVPGAEVVANPGGYADAAGLPGRARRASTRSTSCRPPRPRTGSQQHLDAVDAAVAAGVRRIVYTSFVGARPDAVFTLVRQHARHRGGRSGATGVRHTFLRHSMYADFVPFFARPRGRPRRDRRAGRRRPGRASSPATTSPTSPPPSCCATTPTCDGQALEVTGPEALTHGRGRRRARPRSPASPPSTAPQTVEEAWATRRPSGHPDWEIEGWVTSYLAIAAGELALGHRRRPER